MKKCIYCGTEITPELEISTYHLDELYLKKFCRLCWEDAGSLTIAEDKRVSTQALKQSKKFVERSNQNLYLESPGNPIEVDRDRFLNGYWKAYEFFLDDFKSSTTP